LLGQKGHSVLTPDPKFVSRDSDRGSSPVAAEDFAENHQSQATASIEQHGPIDQNLDLLTNPQDCIGS